MWSTFKHLILAVSLSFLSVPAFAEVYHLSGDLTWFSDDDVGPGSFNISFQTADGDIADAGGASVIGISGTFFGRNITGLSTFNSANNRLYDAASHYFDLNGISFTFAPVLGADMESANLFYNGTSQPWFEPVGTFAAIGCTAKCGLVESLYKVSSTTTTTAVPEPETYAMFMAGLGGLGFVARRRKMA